MVTKLTPYSFNKLKEELEHLKGIARLKLMNEINKARDEGDLRENSGYHALREEQAKQESRIRQLEDLLDNSELEDINNDNKVVAVGKVVTLNVNNKKVRAIFGTRNEIDDTNISICSPDSPLGVAINGLRVGKKTYYNLPNGNRMNVEILDIEQVKH